MQQRDMRWWRRSARHEPELTWLKPLPWGPVVFDVSLCTVAARPVQETVADRIPTPRRAA